MALKFHPAQGMVLICDYSTGFILPEMIKKRPAVVITPRPRRQRQLCTVIPLSTTRPNPIENYHHRLNALSLPGKLAQVETWAKCDMLATVSLGRLDRIKSRNESGKRFYMSHHVIGEDLEAIIKGVLTALGIKNLTVHL
jgi:mRNA interferase MazF